MVFAQNREILDLQGVVKPEHVMTLRNDAFTHLVKDARAALKRCREIGIDAVIDCELFARVSALLAWKSGAKVRVGFHPHTQEGLYRGSFMNRPVLYNPYQHIASQFLSLAAAIDGEGTPTVKREVELTPPTLERLELPAADIQTLRERLLADFPVLQGRRLVLLSPAGGLLPIRAWPLDRYADLAGRLIAEGHAVGVIGLDRDRPVAEALQAEVPGPHLVDLTGWTRSVREVLLLFHVASLLVANDGGPGHFAALTPIPSVVFFGPETDLLYGTLGEGAVNLRANLSCSPCLTAYNHRSSPCDGNNVCLQRITVEEVLELSLTILARKG
jgi:ADP-heptose:LPS heptosyltransferase